MTSGRPFRVFISGVTNEVGKARGEIASDLRARGLIVREQKDFRQESGSDTTLAKIEAYIRDCDAVVHIAGRRSGAFPDADEAKPFEGMLPGAVARASYTQWEFHFARHHGRRVSKYIANRDHPPDSANAPVDDDPASQIAHLALIEKLDRDYFSTDEQLRVRVLREDWPHLTPRKPRNLPFSSLGSLFKGRDAELDKLVRALSAPRASRAAISIHALHGLGGVGKTRLAIEYAHLHADEHSALIFLSAETPEGLEAGLAALAGPDMFDLPENDAKEDSTKIPATLAWLARHPGWLMILDNVDDENALKAVQALLANLTAGTAIITGRLSSYPAAVQKLEVGILEPKYAAAFLLQRTQGSRLPAVEDEAQAHQIASELDGLALGLEQAGAYIAAERISFSHYLDLWQSNRGKVVGWFNEELMSYARSTGLAATWATSVAKLSPPARRLLERLAMLSSEPIPDLLLDVGIPNATEGDDVHAARSQLFTYSLATRVGDAAKPAFVLHRLVQDFARRSMSQPQLRQTQNETLGWVAAAFIGNVQDRDSWPVLDALAPHALTVASYADAITGSFLGLHYRLGALFHQKGRYQEAEMLLRQALAFDEAHLAPNDPSLTYSLNELGRLLTETNRTDEAEGLLRRALALAVAGFGASDPSVAITANNLAALLLQSNRSSEAEQFLRQALEIEEATTPLDPNRLAASLGNLASLLQQTGRPEEAEPIVRRALKISDTFSRLNPMQLAAHLNTLAQVLMRTNRVADAETPLRRALAVNEENLGPTHPLVASALHNLAVLLSKTNRDGDAETLYRRAVSINEASLGPDHPRVAENLTGWAVVLRNTNRRAEAKRLLERAVATFEASIGADHPNTLIARNHLAKLRSE